MGSCRNDRLCHMGSVLQDPQLMTARFKWEACSRTTFLSGVITDDGEDETWKWLQPCMYVKLRQVYPNPTYNLHSTLGKNACTIGMHLKSSNLNYSTQVLKQYLFQIQFWCKYTQHLMSYSNKAYIQTLVGPKKQLIMVVLFTSVNASLFTNITV